MNDGTFESSKAEREAESLREIGGRWRFILRGIHASPLASPCQGESPFFAAVERLRDSALVWPAFDSADIVESNATRLDRIYDATFNVLSHFDDVRQSAPPTPLKDEWLIETGWAASHVHSPRAQEWVKSTYFRMNASSRPALSVDTPPSIEALCESGVCAYPPFTDAHLASVASLVCLARALYALHDVLGHWRGAVAQLNPRLHFDGHAGSVDWVEAISEARHQASVRDYEADGFSYASIRIAQAESWLACAEQTLKASKLALQAVCAEQKAQTAKRKDAALKTLDFPHETRDSNKSAVERAARRQDAGLDRADLTAQVASITGLTRTTVRKHLRSLGLIS